MNPPILPFVKLRASYYVQDELCAPKGEGVRIKKLLTLRGCPFALGAK